jgi:hypothetical protein
MRSLAAGQEREGAGDSAPRATVPWVQPAPAARLLALQRSIGNARVARAVRTLARQPYHVRFATLLGQAPFAGDPDAATVLAGLQGRQFTRQDTMRWLKGDVTEAEWVQPGLDQALEALGRLGQPGALLEAFKDFAGADALTDLQAFATRQFQELTQLLAQNPNAGAPWTNKFTTMRTAVQAIQQRMAPLNWNAWLAGRAAPANWRGTRAEFEVKARTAMLDHLEDQLRILVDNERQIRVAGRLKFSQKRANYKFSSAATVANVDLNAVLGGKEVTDIAAQLTAGAIQPDFIRVLVFRHHADLVAINNRGLAALSLAGFRPTNVILVDDPGQDIRNRLGETDTFRLPGGVRRSITAPNFEMVLTQTDTEADKDAVALATTR